MNKFNPIRLFRKALKAWQEYKEVLEARQELDKTVRANKSVNMGIQKAVLRAQPTQSSETLLQRHYRDVLLDITGETREYLSERHLECRITYEDMYKWYAATGRFPCKDQCIGIRHFGVDVILKAISAGERDNT